MKLILNCALYRATSRNGKFVVPKFNKRTGNTDYIYTERLSDSECYDVLMYSENSPIKPNELVFNIETKEVFILSNKKGQIFDTTNFRKVVAIHKNNSPLFDSDKVLNLTTSRIGDIISSNLLFKKINVVLDQDDNIINCYLKVYGVLDRDRKEAVKGVDIPDFSKYSNAIERAFKTKRFYENEKRK